MPASCNHPFRRLGAAVATGVVFSTLAWLHAFPPAEENPQLAEEIIHLVPGAQVAGKPAVADPSISGKLKISVLDVAANELAHCRINVVGPDGNYYEPDERSNPLWAWSLQRKGNRLGKGPFRYYGWFFYCDGTCEVNVPPGDVRIEVWKGFEFEPVGTIVSVAAGETTEARLGLSRTADWAARGWHSGDTHIHLDRRTRTDDQRALDLAAAEDIRFAHILAMNEPRIYVPLMEQQLHPQLQGMGKVSERARGIYQIASGQEYRANTYGHICLIGGSRIVEADGLKTNPNNWPPFGMVADELHGIGGFAFHAHGGYGKEIYADFAQRATDGVELLQFAEYRDIGLEGWYHILNAGYRFPAIGASDYPYCRALGDCRTYCFLGAEAPTFENWNKAAAAGRSFFTTGPLVDLVVNGKRPGETLELPAGQHTVDIHLAIHSPVGAAHEFQIILGGGIERRRIRVGEGYGRTLQTLTSSVTLKDSTWIAARVFARHKSGREDIEAHTNPVYIKVGDTSPVNQDSVRWLINKLDDRITANAARKFEQKGRLIEYLQKSREALESLLAKEP
jgi:hypothetical protein